MRNVSIRRFWDQPSIATAYKECLNYLVRIRKSSAGLGSRSKVTQKHHWLGEFDKRVLLR